MRQLFMASGFLAFVLLMGAVGRSGGQPAPPPQSQSPSAQPTSGPAETVVRRPVDPTAEGYEYAKRGARLKNAAIISTLAIETGGNGQPAVKITIVKGPDYDSNDPEKYGYPGVSFQDVLAGSKSEDKDSAQAVVIWKDSKGQSHGGDNLVPGPTLTRAKAANWEWVNKGSQDAVYTQIPIGSDATELTVLLVYTDVLYAYLDEDEGPDDAPAIIGSWDATRVNGDWQYTARGGEVGIGGTPEMDRPAQLAASKRVKTMIEERTGGLYTLKVRNNIGEWLDPKDPSTEIELDSGFDIVPVTGPTTAPAGR
jgi:hypothetical protein